MSEFSGELTHVELANIPLWWIALLPFLGAVTNALFGRDLQASPWMKDLKKRWHIGSPAVSAVAVGAMLGAFLLTCAGVWQLYQLPPAHRYIHTHAWQMVRIGSLDVSFSFAMDPLSAMMTLIITGVGTLIHIYATSYMEKEPAYWRFFTYLNLFVFSMLLLVLGDNFIVMFFGWEGVGLCSYLLIGFWYKDYKKATAGMKAFVVNRIGDWGFVCGMALLFWGLGGAWLDRAATNPPDGPRQGDYQPDFRPRFVAATKIEPAHAEHGGNDAAPHGAHDSKPHGLAAPTDDRRLAQHEGHEHGTRKGRGDGSGQGKGQSEGAHHRRGERDKPRADVPPRPGKAPEQIAVHIGVAQLTMTTHAGARVYLDVPSVEHLAKLDLPPCSSKPAWSDASGQEPQIRQDCYAVSPFVRKRIPAGRAHLIVVPGDGAVVAGDGDEIATMTISPAAHSETIVTAVGPTLTFRELHDQIVMKDRDGKQFLKDALNGKTVWGIALITLACICFFIGASGKSAQLPLYVWLPDAMAGPTPVSALIHAATMVTAGVYMIARMNFLFSLSPVASGIVALVGACTALFAATMGFFQYDLKKVLAYSTVSQLGFMFIGVGSGAYWAGAFHLMTHAFFKACLFLAAGSVIHGMHHLIHDEVGSQDMRNMGGLRAVMPKTAWCYKMACIAITAAPPGFAGFWSKDEILWKAYNQNTSFVPGWLIYTIGLMAALGTSFYMWRSYYLTFEGKHAHKEIKNTVVESPTAIVAVLQVLAVLSIVSGVFFGLSSHILGAHGPLLGGLIPAEPRLEQWLHPVLAHHSAVIGDAGLSRELVLMGISVACAIGAWSIAKLRYGADRARDWDAVEQKLPGFELLHNKYWVDEIYQATIVAAFMKTRLVLADMDRFIVDGVVNGVAVLTRGGSWVVGAIDKHIVDGAVNLVANGTLLLGGKLRQVQTGRVQNYIYGILGGVATLAIIQYLLG
jgi:NADH-quinone oxidoreductase subunit L